MTAILAISGGVFPSAALAQRPRVLPGLTIDQAAASRATLLAVIIAVAGGAIVLVPSLFLLFRLFLRGRLDPAATPDAAVVTPPLISHPRPRLLAAFAGATFLIGAAVTVFADPGWARALGIICLFACAISTFGLATAEPDQTTQLRIHSR